MTTRVDVSLRLYRLLLGVYPRPFRERYQAELEAAFLAERARDRGAVGFWGALLRDLLTSAGGERIRRLNPWHRRPVHPNLPESPPKAPIEMMIDLFRECRYALRSLAQTPAYTCTVLAVLALGIGANAVVFTVVNELFLTPPAGVEEPERLVRVMRTEDGEGRWFSYPDYEVFRDRNRTFTSLAAYDPDGMALTVGRAGASERESARGILVTGDYFGTLGVRPAHGRLLQPADSATIREGAVAVLSHRFWQQAFGGDAAVVGQDISVNGHPFTVVGVAPAGFQGINVTDRVPDLWVPLTMQPVLGGRSDEFLIREEGRTVTWLLSVGRLPADVSIEAAQADLDGVNAYLAEEFAYWNETQGVRVLGDFMYQPTDRERLVGFAKLLGGVVGVVLLIVCANIAVLQLVRASRRQREIGIRAALGAGRLAVVRQLFLESALLSLGGALIGFLAAIWLSGLAASLLPVRLNADFVPDARVFLFSLLVAGGASVLFGIAPAWSAARTDVVRSLAARGVAGGDSRVRSGLVVLQVALSVVLVGGAALFVRSLVEAEGIDVGYDVENRVVVGISPRSHGYDPAATDTLLRDVLERLRGEPGVEDASAMVMAPFSGSMSSTFNPQGDEDEANEVRVWANIVAPRYFDVMGIPVLAGREFEDGDVRGGDSVLVINEAAAQIMFPQQEALGQSIAWEGEEPVDRIVGIVGNTNYSELGEEPLPIVYSSIHQGFPFRVYFVARGRAATVVLPAIQSAVHAVDPDLAFTTVRTVQEMVETEIGPYRLGARAVSLFGVLAAGLAALGLYGVLSVLVAGQRREIGVRLALGATGGGVTLDVLRRGLALAAVGVALGLVLALSFASALASMLYRVSPYDPVSLVVVSVLLLSVATVASLVPARRAARVDPMVALRGD